MSSKTPCPCTLHLSTSSTTDSQLSLWSLRFFESCLQVHSWFKGSFHCVNLHLSLLTVTRFGAVRRSKSFVRSLHINSPICVTWHPFKRSRPSRLYFIFGLVNVGDLFIECFTLHITLPFTPDHNHLPNPPPIHRLPLYIRVRGKGTQQVSESYDDQFVIFFNSSWTPNVPKRLVHWAQIRPLRDNRHQVSAAQKGQITQTSITRFPWWLQKDRARRIVVSKD